MDGAVLDTKRVHAHGFTANRAHTSGSIDPNFFVGTKPTPATVTSAFSNVTIGRFPGNPCTGRVVPGNDGPTTTPTSFSIPSVDWVLTLQISALFNGEASNLHRFVPGRVSTINPLWVSN